jgi:hypothetical protein
MSPQFSFLYSLITGALFTGMALFTLVSPPTLLQDKYGIPPLALTAFLGVMGLFRLYRAWVAHKRRQAASNNTDS